MKFNAKKAEHDYITGTMSYRKLAEKYEVDQATISKYGKKGCWVKKRKEYQAKVQQKALEKTVEKEADKLATLNSATDEAISIVAGFINDFNDESSFKYKNFKDVVSTLKELTNLQRNLNGILTVQEENSLALAREKLQIERERLGFDEGETGETGIVYIPEIAPEVTENVVIEGEADA